MAAGRFRSILAHPLSAILSPDLIARVQQAAALMNAGRFDGARPLLENAARAAPDHPDILRLLAAARRAGGDLAGAEAALRRALTTNPTHQDAAVDLATLLSSQGRHEDLLAGTERAAAAEIPRVLLLGERSRALKTLRRPAEALEVARRAARLYPDNAAAHHNLAATAIDAGQAQVAVEAARRALALAPASGASWLVLARALQTLNRLIEAEEAYRRISLSDPMRVEAAADLSQLIWMRDGDADAALVALDALLPGAADAEARVILRARLLSAAGREDAAADETEAASNLQPRSIGLAVAASQALTSLQPEQGLALARRARALAPDDTRVARQWIEALLATGDGDQALPLIQDLRRDKPLDQGIIAAELTALRLTGRPLPKALHDLDAVVGVSWIDLPPGWGSLDAFLADLAARLEGLHADRRAHPIGQSLRQGTQTGVDLAILDDPVIAAFRQAVSGPVSRYIERLGRGDDDLRARITGRWRFHGMWSARLEAGGGHHTNHVHPEGWLSSACYIALPSDVSNNAEAALLSPHDGPGRLRLGQPGGPAARLIAPDRFVQPAPGRLVLFPSYLWHGTSPFQGPGTRLSVAFDITPF